MEPRGLIFFDIDGTLTRGVNSGIFVAERLGIGDEMRAAEEAYARGEMDNAAVCRVDAAGYAGLRVQDVEAWLDGMPLIDGIAPALAICRDAGLEPYLASCTWSYIGAYLARRFGFSGWCGPELEVVDGVFTGEVARDADEFANRRSHGTVPARSASMWPRAWRWGTVAPICRCSGLWAPRSRSTPPPRHAPPPLPHGKATTSPTRFVISCARRAHWVAVRTSSGSSRSRSSHAARYGRAPSVGPMPRRCTIFEGRSYLACAVIAPSSQVAHPATFPS